MKLIRLTSTSDNGTFDNSFNNDIVIPANSELSLGSLSLELAPKDITIDGNNNTIVYEVANGQGATVTLDQARYTSETAKTILFQDMSNKMNLSLDGNRGGVVQGSMPTGIQIGMQFKAGVVDETYPESMKKAYTGKFGMAYKIKNERQLLDTSWALTNVKSEGSGNTTTYSRNDAAEGNELSYALSKHPITKGCGSLLTELHKFEEGSSSDGDVNGVFIGITTKSNATTRAECEFGFQAPYKEGTSGGEPNFIKYLLGTASDFGGNAAEIPAGSYIGLETIEGVVYGVYYQDDGSGGGVYDRSFLDDVGTEAGTVSKYTLLSKADGSPKDYYVMIMFFGATAKTQIRGFKWSPDAWNNSTTTEDLRIDLGHNLGVGPTPSPVAGNGFIEFEPSLARFLGYQNPRIPLSGSSKLGRPNFIWNGSFLFSGVNLSDSYYVELLSLNVDSYDGFTSGRKNILAVVPQLEQSNTASNENVVIYEPPYPVFLDLRNDAPITLRNIRARVVYSDGSAVVTNALSVMSLLFKKSRMIKQ
tara:strand:+ start:402 stop:1997 length:1596 start_codon:yes stop_codon:yes gene_type:complete